MDNKLKELREQKKLTLTELATQLKDAVNFSVTPTTLARYEKGKREPKLATWQKLADFFDVDLEYILGYSPFKKDMLDTLKNSLQEKGISISSHKTGFKDLDKILEASSNFLDEREINSFTTNDAMQLEYLLTEYINLFVTLKKISLDKNNFSENENKMSSDALIYFMNLLDDIGDTDDSDFLYNMRDKLEIIE